MLRSQSLAVGQEEKLPDGSNGYAEKVLESMGLRESLRRTSSFAFSSKQPGEGWEAFAYEVPVAVYFVRAGGATYGQVRTLASGIKADNFVLVADLGTNAVVVMKRAKKGENVPLVVPIRREEDLERVANTLRKFNFTSDELTAHASVGSAVEQLRVGAERFYTNRGLFANYYLNERLIPSLIKRGRNPQRESTTLISRFGGEFPVSDRKSEEVLKALGYGMRPLQVKGHRQYALTGLGSNLNVSCVVTESQSLDTKKGDEVVPSYQAVATLSKYGWVILTNGRFWRLYSGRVQSTSTNYFEVDMEGVIAENDPKLSYFIGMFSASSFQEREGTTDVDLTFDGGVQYAKEIEEDLKAKVFDGQLFVSLVKSVVGHSSKRKYNQAELETAKSSALKLLYRLLFILYAESRALLPVADKTYAEMSLGNLRQRLPAMDKEPESASAWKALQTLFRAISKGKPEASVPVYDGALFERDNTIDPLEIENRFLVKALLDLTESGGRGIDYGNLGVRHLGSLYEALLEYSVRQAEQDLVVYKDEVLDASYASDINAKPRGYIAKGDLYLTAGGLARKGTGSYFTPDEIVQYLVQKGLEPHFRAREEQFLKDMMSSRALDEKDKDLEKKTIDDLLGLKVVDPAMGSGHFLVAAVDEVTKWVIGLLKENPDAPLQKEIEGDRQKIILEQFKNGIKLDEDLLTDSIILKRMVMKRCVYGVDINPLAVELAKLSLWLDSFTIGTPLTFLDHHVRCGDALIGFWVEKISKKALEATLDTWTGTLSSAVSTLFWETSTSPDLTLDQLDQSRKSFFLVREKTGAGRALLDLETAKILDPVLGRKLPGNISLIQETLKLKQKPLWWSKVQEGFELALDYGAFHWEFEFPEAFGGDKKGFDMVVMNPPWEVFMPEDDDFFSVYYPRFRIIANKPEKRNVMNDLLKRSEVALSYEQYKERIARKLSFFRESGQYPRSAGANPNLWKLFLERALSLVSVNGSLSLVLPSGIVTDEGAKDLREALFQGRIRSLYEFENKYGIFPDVDKRYKFALLTWGREEPAQDFPAAFYLHNMTALQGKAEQEKFVEIPSSLPAKFAPDTLSIPEVRNKSQLELLTKLHTSHHLLNDVTKGWSVKIIREFNRTDDSDLFHRDQKGWPLIEGKSFHQFVPDYERPEYFIDRAEGFRRLSRRKDFKYLNEKMHERVRLAFRLIASSTNVRTMVACVLPPRCWLPNLAPTVIPLVNGEIPDEKEFAKLVSYLAAVFNSFVFDFIVRSKMSTSLNYFYVYQSPVPSGRNDREANALVDIARRLSAVDQRFDGYAAQLEGKAVTVSLRDRIELTAQLNALVAKKYGLTRRELEQILESFDAFEEDKNLENLKEFKWDDTFVRKFNGEVRKRVLPYFDKLMEGKA